MTSFVVGFAMLAFVSMSMVFAVGDDDGDGPAFACAYAYGECAVNQTVLATCGCVGDWATCLQAKIKDQDLLDAALEPVERACTALDRLREQTMPSAATCCPSIATIPPTPAPPPPLPPCAPSVDQQLMSCEHVAQGCVMSNPQNVTLVCQCASTFGKCYRPLIKQYKGTCSSQALTDGEGVLDTGCKMINQQAHKHCC